MVTGFVWEMSPDVAVVVPVACRVGVILLWAPGEWAD